MKKLNVLLFVLVMALPCGAFATMVQVNMTVDNDFIFYVSTDNSVAGTLIGSGTNWQVTYTINAVLQPGVTNYLHIYGDNYGGPGCFIGGFTLSDAGFDFANGTQYLKTNATNWQVSKTGFNGGYQTATSYGTNGIGPWWFRPGIDGTAEWIWTDEYEGPTAYLSTPIYYIPEPMTLAFLTAGMFLWSRKRPH